MTTVRTVPMMAEAKPTSIEVRVPWSIQDRTSWPWLVVPSQCSALGGLPLRWT